jgi:hypothetical protein
MADDIERQVRELLDDGYTAAEIREALVQEGYDAAIIDEVLADLSAGGRRQPPAQPSNDSGVLWRFQQYSWIAAYLAMLVGYVMLSRQPLLGNTLGSTVVRGLFGLAGIVFAAHILAGLYWLFQGHFRRFGISVGGVAVTTAGIGGAAFLLIQEFAGAAGQFTALQAESAAALGFGMAPWLFNAGMIVMGVTAALLLYRRTRLLAISLPLLFVILFAGLWGMQYMQLTGAADAMKQPELSAVVDAPDVNHLLRGAAQVPPPFGKTAAAMVLTADIGSTYAHWSALVERNAGSSKSPLTGPGAVCGGTRKNIEEQYERPVSRMLATFDAYLLADMQESQDEAVESLVARCNRQDMCTADRATLREDLNTYSAWNEDRLDTYKDLFGVTLRGTPVRVDDCTPPPEQYYGVELQNISCSTPFTAELAYTGTRPLSSAVEVFVYDRNQTLAGSGRASSVRDWSSGTRTVSADGIFRSPT